MYLPSAVSSFLMKNNAMQKVSHIIIIIIIIIIIMFHAQSTAKGHIRAKQNVFLLLIHYLGPNTHSTVEDWRNLGKMKLNELGRQILGM